jgi:hypothetical protein
MVDTLRSSINYDRFEIAKTGNSFWPSVSVVGGGAGGWGSGEAVTTIAHGLGFTPVIVAYVQELGTNITQNFVVPSFSYFGLGTSALWINLQIATDATNIYVITDLATFGVTGTSSFLGGAAGGFICQYYLLSERIKRVS